MTDIRRGPLDLLALTPLQRGVIVHLTREGPADANTLAQALSKDPAQMRQTLAGLAKMGSIRLSADGQACTRLLAKGATPLNCPGSQRSVRRGGRGRHSSLQ